MSEKTEQPTPKRIRDSREKGDICKGQDVAPAAVVLAFSVYAIVNGEAILKTLIEMVEIPFHVMHLPFKEALSQAGQAVLDLSLDLVFPVVGLVMIAALGVLVAQTGMLFAPKAAVPKFENIHPKKWFQKVFSIKNLFELGKNILKVTILSIIVGIVFNHYTPVLFNLGKGSVSAMWSVLGQALGELLLYCSAAFAVVAAFDYLYQKYKWNKDHMMSIDEVKREYKESEGDPMIKSQRKNLHRELINQNTVANVRKAKVLVVNPTHYAVALDYDKDKTPLPVILAKGEGALAQRMIEEAKLAGVPVMRNVPLAQALFRDGTVNAYIPSDLIESVAEVLRWVEGLDTPGGR